MLALTIGLIVFIIFHQRKVIRYQLKLQRMEQDQQSFSSTPLSACRKRKDSVLPPIFTTTPAPSWPPPGYI
jgi:hypothetical protein